MLKNGEVDNISVNFEDYCRLKEEVERNKKEINDLTNKLKKLTNTSKSAINSAAFMKSTLEDVLSVINNLAKARL